MAKPEIVLNFSNLAPSKADVSPELKSTSATSRAPARRLERLQNQVTGSGLNAPNPHLRMANDTLGEELKPHGTIWKLYEEEATEQDADLTEIQNKNLDLMLLFAALFSAILTAFLIESKSLLQQDSAETSATLLLFIAQSQQRLELGIPTTVLTPIESSPFSPPMGARVVNGLWFAALALSLAAALIAMLAKEWLAAYIKSSVRPTYDRALARQSRFDGLTLWRALHIIALLPSLLHLSLFLFLLGLVIYLWSLDKAIAIIIAMVSGVTCLLYGATAVLGAVFESCPFVTQISKYIRVILGPHLKGRIRRRKTTNLDTILSNDALDPSVAQALTWLAENSRDPAVVACTYQALAGFVAAGDKAIPPSGYPPMSVTDAARLDPNHLHRLDRSSKHLEVSFFNSICDLLSKSVTHNLQDLAVSQGTNVVRCALALPKLVQHIGSQPLSDTTTDVVAGGLTRNALEIKATIVSPSKRALEALEAVLHGNGPSMSSDAYALLTAAKLGVLVTSAAFGQPEINAIDTSPAIEKGGNDPHRVVLISANRAPLLSMTLLGLLHLSQSAIACATVQLRYHTDGRAPINADCLVRLMESLLAAVTCDALKVHGTLFRDDLVANVVGVGVEPLGSSNHLTNTLIDMLKDSDPREHPRLDAIIGHTLFAVASLQLDGTNLGHISVERNWEMVQNSTPNLNLSSEITTSQQRQCSEWILEQLLVLASFHGDRFQHQLPSRALSAISQRIKKLNLASPLDTPTETHRRLVRDLVNVLDAGFLKDSAYPSQLQAARVHLMQFFEGAGVIASLAFSADTLLMLLGMMADVPHQSSKVERLLPLITNCSLRENVTRSFLFSEPNGFMFLLDLAEQAEYQSIVSQEIQRLVRIGRLDISNENLLNNSSVASLLHATWFVLEHFTPSETYSSLHGFLDEVLDCFQRGHAADNDFLRKIKVHWFLERLYEHNEGENNPYGGELDDFIRESRDQDMLERAYQQEYSDDGYVEEGEQVGRANSTESEGEAGGNDSEVSILRTPPER